MLFEQWKRYFLFNRDHFNHIDLEQPDLLTPTEKSMISSSLQQFQRGEHSEGKYLLAAAKSVNDPDYLESIKLFIQEEQRHAMVLSAYMNKKQIRLIRAHWVDRVFRNLRRVSGIENTLRVLLVAEIIARVYYHALAYATSSALLQDICFQIQKDEDRHISFQCDALHSFQQQKNVFRRWFFLCWQFVLMTSAVLVVWFYHRRVLYKGGYSFGKFVRRSLSLYFNAERQISRQPAAQFDFGR